MKLEPGGGQWYGCSDRKNQMFAATKPAPPDPAYCAHRDADPEKCVIQDGPPHKPIVRKKRQPPK